jgi:hypothetical protein
MERNSTDKRIDDLADRVGRFESRFERFEVKVEAGFEKVARFDKMVTKDEFEIAASDTKERFAKVEDSIAALSHKVETTNRTLLGGIIVAVAIKFLFG